MIPLYIEPNADQNGSDETEFEGRLTDEQINTLVQEMYQLHLCDRSVLDRIYRYTKGEAGVPQLPEGASDEVAELAKLSVKNILGMVRNSFAQSLSVVGYRSAAARENAPAWSDWQRNRMDARQSEVYRPAVQYGTAYVTVSPSPSGPEWRCRSPRQLIAVYDDPVLDAWPQYGLETWVSKRNAKRHRRGVFYDDKYLYELDLGELPGSGSDQISASTPVTVRKVEDVIEHGATDYGKPVCPIVRFINDRDAEDMIVGEIEPLIGMQKAINSVNFDRLIVARFGANPQRVISGWTGSKNEVLKASALRVWTFEDPEVKAQAFPPASVEPYNAVLEEMEQHVAKVAHLSPTAVTGKIANVSAEALAAAEHKEQLKLANKRESFGESWEQLFRVSSAMSGDADTAVDLEAEVIWRDTEARSFATVVDGVVKLASAGVPIEHLLTLVPGMTQQLIAAIKDALRAKGNASLVDKLLAGPAQPIPDPNTTGEAVVTGAGGGDGAAKPADAAGGAAGGSNREAAAAAE